jgi:pilus assembly protein FimV
MDRLKWLFAALIMLAPCIAGAAGLGSVTVLSTLGQPFHAEIDLIGIQQQEMASLSARVAQRDAYQRAGLLYNATVANLQLDVRRRANGERYIRITSTGPASDFVIHLLIDVMWASGRLIRTYSVPLDLPGTQQSHF